MKIYSHDGIKDTLYSTSKDTLYSTSGLYESLTHVYYVNNGLMTGISLVVKKAGFFRIGRIDGARLKKRDRAERPRGHEAFPLPFVLR